MKFKVSKEKLLEGLQVVQNVVSTRTTLPILSNVLVRATSSSVGLVTTDLDMGVSCEVDADVVKGGVATLPERRLFAIIRELPASEVEVDIDEKYTASIRCGSSFFKILGLSEEEFPPLPKVDAAKSLKIDQAVLRGMLKKTAYAMSGDETRYVLNGIFMSFKDDKLTMVATDGRRLALAEHDVDLPRGTSTELILPSKAVGELQRLLAESGSVQISLMENQVAFQLQSDNKDSQRSILLVSKLVEGSFPNYRQVIPSETKERITLERETLLSALHRASILTSEKSSSVKLTFSKNTLSIAVSSPEVGESRETLAIDFKGKEISVAFNPGFLMDPLRNLDADEVFLELTDELSPGVLKVTEPFLYVVMPMRMN
jgi:DNA polymerase III subunit beta